MKRDLSDEDVWVALNFYAGEGADLTAPDGGESAGGFCAVAGGPAALAPMFGGLAAAALMARRRKEIA